MSQTTGPSTQRTPSAPSADELAALEKLEAAQLLADQCKALDEAENASHANDAWLALFVHGVVLVLVLVLVVVGLV